MPHCQGYRAAAVARDDVLASLGIDAEPHVPLPAGVMGGVALPDERRHLARLARSHPQVAWERVPSSAKESVYRASLPLTGRWLGFLDRAVAPDPDNGTFTAALRVPGPVDRFTGRWRVPEGQGHGLVGTGRRRTRACLICLRGHQVARQLDAHGGEIYGGASSGTVVPGAEFGREEIPEFLPTPPFPAIIMQPAVSAPDVFRTV
jgi:hypothetical protein